MKQLLLIIALFAGVTSIKAQTTYVSAETRQVCYWVAADSKFSNCGELETYESMFTLNADETMFVHTTKDIKSSYYIKNKTYNPDNQMSTYDVVSDVGNKYKFIFGKPAVNFIILSTGHTDDKDDYIMKFPIKKRWTD